jgi:uncharacterized repeat protein (TIGR03806 family)
MEYRPNPMAGKHPLAMCLALFSAALAPACQSSDAPPAGPPDGSDGFGLSTRPSNRTCKPPARYTDPAPTLSATGCVDSKDPTRPAAGLIPYLVASPLWSDGASKQRFLALPDGQKIHVKDCSAEPTRCQPASAGGSTDDEGHFELPVGTVLMKNFLFGGKIFETRLFVRFSETRWVGYSYAWNADHSDATVVGIDGAHADVTNDQGARQGWAFPSRSDCSLCHNDVVGSSLGLETRQLNIDYRYPSGVTSNQLATLDHIGLFDAAVKPLPPYPDPAGGGSLDQRARSYLHANCAICHRPEGKFPGIDLRWTVALASMGVCNQDSTKGTAGATPPAQRLVPGHPEQSTVYTRMATLEGDTRMPQVATAVVDPVGTPLVAEWIKALTACQ